MAEAIFNKTLPDKLRRLYRAESAGIFAQSGIGASGNSIAALLSFGIDISSHRAKRLDLDLCDDVTLFVCMTDAHAEHLLSLGVCRERLTVLEIADPFGGDLNRYLDCAQEIFNKMPKIFEMIGTQNED